MTEKLTIIAGQKYVDDDSICWTCVLTDMPEPWPFLMRSGEMLARFSSDGCCRESFRKIIAPWTEPEPPKLRAWKAEEVPVGCLLAYPHDADKSSKGILLHCNGIMVWTSFEQLIPKTIESLSVFVHSTDHGATWSPCGILEEAKP